MPERWRGPSEPRTYIGFYGCEYGDRVVAVASPPYQGKPHWNVGWRVHECPACGEDHTVKVMWRRREAGDRNAELQLLQRDRVETVRT